MLENITTVYKNLPSNVFAFTMYHSVDDWYTIVLNSNKSYEQLKKSFEHEIQHILNKDFSNFREVNSLELAMH